MIIVIIAGGSGTRLWPLSTPLYPKHLLKIGDDSKSLLQNTYERAKRVAKKIYVVTEASHVGYVKDQLQELPEDHFIVEPGRRGTANCIIGALAYLSTQHDADEAIAFMAADHFVRDTTGFVYSFKVAEKVTNTYKQVTLIGVEPDYPATGFGYIKKGNRIDDSLLAYTVDSFHEKPSFKTAQKYLRSGDYVWNCSYFVGSVNTFTQTIQQDAPDLYKSYELLKQHIGQNDYNAVYMSLTADAIDYALNEKATNFLVVPASFDWMDIGSFGDLAKVTSVDDSGNFVEGTVELEDTRNTYVQNHGDQSVLVIGLDNCVVVNTPEGILVTRKDLAQKVGAASKRLVHDKDTTNKETV